MHKICLPNRKQNKTALSTTGQSDVIVSTLYIRLFLTPAMLITDTVSHMYCNSRALRQALKTGQPHTQER